MKLKTCQPFESLKAHSRITRAVQLRVAEQYIGNFGQLAKAGNTLILPANLSDIGSMIALAMNVIRQPQVSEQTPTG